MPRIKNISFNPIIFRSKPTKDEPAGSIVEILPDETKDVDIDPDNVDLVARVNARLVAIEDGSPEKPRGKAKADGEGGTATA